MKLKQLNIVLADDDMDDCIFFKEALETIKILTNLTTVQDGEQLMQLLTSENYKLPQVLFLDINMPRKNGFECLAEIKQNEKLKDIPIVIFSTSLDVVVVDFLYNAGARYFIRKPAEFSQFKKIIQQTLTLIMEQNKILPTRDNFVLSVPSLLSYL